MSTAHASRPAPVGGTTTGPARHKFHCLATLARTPERPGLPRAGTSSSFAAYAGMDDLEKQLVELDLDIAKAKRYRREQKDELKPKSASGEYTSEIEKTLKKTKQALNACKATRQDIIDQLLEAEAARTKDAVSAK